MVRNFIPNCDLCGCEIPLEKHAKRNVPADGLEMMIVVLENFGSDLEVEQRPDGTVDLDTCRDCYARIAFSYSKAVN